MVKKLKKEKLLFKLYKDIIMEKVKSDEGFFIVYRVGDKWYYEILNKELGLEMFWISWIKVLLGNFSFYLNVGFKIGIKMVCWERKDNKILVWIVFIQNVVDDVEVIYEFVCVNNFELIWQFFKIVVLNEDIFGVVIDVIFFFFKEVVGISQILS